VAAVRPSRPLTYSWDLNGPGPVTHRGTVDPTVQFHPDATARGLAELTWVVHGPGGQHPAGGGKVGAAVTPAGCAGHAGTLSTESSTTSWPRPGRRLAAARRGGRASK
jgi:hypothetical protein